MKRSLKPIYGALVAGLVGVSYATCWSETSSVCRHSGDIIAYQQNGGCNNEVHASVDWYQMDQVPTESGGHTGKLAPDFYCQGPAYVHNCVDMGNYSIGTFSDPSITYKRLDYTSPSCP